MQQDEARTVVRSGFGLWNLFSFCLAAFCSWQINQSFLWMIFHGFCGTWYLLYLCGGCGGGFEKPEEGFRQLLEERERADQPAEVSPVEGDKESIQEVVSSFRNPQTSPTYSTAIVTPIDREMVAIHLLPLNIE